MSKIKVLLLHCEYFLAEILSSICLNQSIRHGVWLHHLSQIPGERA